MSEEMKRKFPWADDEADRESRAIIWLRTIEGASLFFEGATSLINNNGNNKYFKPEINLEFSKSALLGTKWSTLRAAIFNMWLIWINGLVEGSAARDVIHFGGRRVRFHWLDWITELTRPYVTMTLALARADLRSETYETAKEKSCLRYQMTGFWNERPQLCKIKHFWLLWDL